ncbi:hypothetical protein [Actinokineospora sp. NBRC 105648]|uniref:DUF7933 domain-containing protein n=1 Tax=Actinokineospora sp. NBRC 105648 TaxID=3032206 RepID=UPI0024A05D5F|nr:hypothetical protein [Actinokineospora sp. NBRC 105648]GLZ39528.1 hypothetical protein Acsp05_31520 [Actinokineospora sp. NBRC 105648]
MRKLLAVAAVAAALTAATAVPAAAAVDPGLGVAYGAALVPVNTRQSLVFTATNSDTLGAVAFTFSLNVPANVRLTDTPASTTCPGGTVTAVANTRAVTASGNLDPGQVACTVTVSVTSSVAGRYTTCAADFSNLVGLTPPATCASIRFAGGGGS